MEYVFAWAAVKMISGEEREDSGNKEVVEGLVVGWEGKGGNGRALGFEDSVHLGWSFVTVFSGLRPLALLPAFSAELLGRQSCSIARLGIERMKAVVAWRATVVLDPYIL